MESKDKDIRLLLNSLIVYFNGDIFSLKKHAPFYSQGKIFIPRELESILLRKVPRRVPLISVKRVVIDPGHGGRDPGAISRRGLKEKDINLVVAKLLKRELEKRGFRVYLTRVRDVYLSLQRRVQIAKERRADLFVSVHTNSNRDQGVNGVEVYFLSPRYSGKSKRVTTLTKRLSLDLGISSNKKGGSGGNIYIGNNTISREFATCLVSIFRKLGFKVRPPQGAPFYVLKYGYVPGVLVEIGYLTNRYEEKLLRSSRYQKQVAEAIALGVEALNDRYTKLAREYMD
jgi:N-acetylmuramoyl-L-alanine amidase